MRDLVVPLAFLYSRLSEAYRRTGSWGCHGKNLAMTAAVAHGRKERGVTDIRGAAAAERIRTDLHRLDELRRIKKQ